MIRKMKKFIYFKTMLLAFMMVGSVSAWGQNYQSFDASNSANVWTNNLWSAASSTNGCVSSSLTNAFVSGNIAYFCTPSGKGTGAMGITIGGIIASESYTHSSSSGTLSTGGKVVTIDVASGKTVDLGSVGTGISTATGTGIIKAGDGILSWSNENAFPGGFILNAGTMIVGSLNALGNGGALNINGGTLAANSTKTITARYSVINIGGNFTFGATNYTSNISFVDNVSLGSATRTINLAGTAGTSTYTFSGIISGTSSAGLTLGTSSGNGFLVLTGVNTYPGTTTVSGGTLRLGVANAIPVASTGGGVVLNGGTLSSGATAGYSGGVVNSTNMGKLTLSATSTIALGTGDHSLFFANSSTETWNGTTLNITGWSGTAGSSGIAGKIFIGSDATGLTASQLAKISFTGYSAGAQILSTGEVVPLVPPTTTYTWQGVDSGDWTTATNWNPTRTTPASTDILQFTDGTTKKVTNVPTQTIGQLKVSGNTSVTLQASGANTLTIAGGTGVDLSVEAGSQLNVSGTNALIIAIATGATGSISGSMDFSGAANQITAADASGITFNSGAVFTQNTNSTGNVFGSGTSNSVIFTNGSTFVQYAGNNPFQKSQPTSVVVFQTGSLFKIKANIGPSFSGRTYANLEIDAAAFSQTNLTGAAGVTMDNFILTNCTNVGMNLTGAMNIKGNISVNSGTLSFSPASATNVNLNGSSSQTISGSGTLTIGSTANFVVDNAVIANRNIAFGGTLTINSGKSLTVNAGKQLTVSTTLTNSGTLNLLSDATGTATILTPGTTTIPGTFNVNQALTGKTGGSTRGWWYISSPISNATAAVFNVAGGTNKLWYYDEVNGSAGPAYKTITDNGTALNAGSGYVASIGGGDATYTFTGTLNNGDITINPSRTGTTAGKRGFNLVGNPYPSFLDWNSTDLVKTNLRSTIWYRTLASGSLTGTMTFDTFDGTIGTGNGQNGTVTRYIPPMQTFWVRVDADPVSPATQSTGTLTFKNTARSHQDQSVAGNRLRVPAKANLEAQLVRLKVSNGINSDEAILVGDANASDAYDSYDSEKMTNNDASIPEIFTLAGTEELVINHLNSLNPDKEVTLGFRPGQTGPFSINVTEITNLAADTKVMLLDKLLGTQQELTIGTPYNFTTANATATNDRFSILFKSASVVSGLNNASTNQNITVYSNPNNRITVISNSGNNDQSVSVYNAVGQKLVTQKLTGTTTEVGNTFTSGVYLVSVNNGLNKVTRRIIIK
jgi:autotransporter-associated beta strand protein